jgi:hypothetical protein
MSAGVFSHRILTEDVNRETVVSIVSKYFDAFTVYPAIGYWKGIPESSLTIDIIGGNYPDVRRAAIDIKAANNQDAVMVFSLQGKQTLV